MTRALGPNAGLPREAAVPFAILGASWTPVAVVALVWLGGRTASLLTGHGWTGPPFGWDFAQTLTGLGSGAGPGAAGTGGAGPGGGVEALWPGTPPLLVWACTVLFAAATLTPIALIGVRWARHRAAPGDPLPALATVHDVRGLAAPLDQQRAQQLRPSLAGRPSSAVTDRDIGVPLGALRRHRGRPVPLRGSWEDVLLAVMAPRAGKTTALAVPAILDAPGAVLATSNKADLWAATAALREEATGERVWVFDPQRIVYADRTWWWNPLAAVTTVEEAYRLAGHFVQEVRPERGDRDFWSAAAHDLLTGLLLAAATAGRDLTEVYEWLNDPVLAQWR